MNPKLIYCAGPYSGDSLEQIEENVKAATRIGIDLMRKGHYSMIPHLSHYTELLAQGDDLGGFPWETWMQQDFDILKRCDAIYFIGPSKGANMEKEMALDLGLEIYYSLSDVPEVTGI